ncbi:MAG TPA: AI-2E family transporter [Actinomycetota bacterium]|nr:AI-2E family transporter [Actinomycetota bacterium]
MDERRVDREAEPKRGSSVWKRLAIALGAVTAAVAAAAVAWGWASPAPETPPVPTEEPEGAELVTIPVGVVTDPRQPPPWVKPTVLWTIAVIVAVGVAFFLLNLLATIVMYLVLALFFSFALEPAANRLVRRGWRPGAATGLLLAVTFLLLIFVGLIFVGAIIRGASAIVANIPEWSKTVADWLSDTFGIQVSTDSLADGATGASASLSASANKPVEVLLGFSASLIGGIFAMFTVGMFIFYMVAEGPKFKRAVLSFFHQERQEELVSIWEAAIDKTGGYFYSKMTLAVINGGAFFVVLVILGVPSAAALATFQGVVAEFIPIVGTYIAAVVPLVIAFLTVGMPETLILLIYVLIYQQIENYLLAPKLQAKAMQLHPAVAFGAALAGGAIGGLLWAFLALPFAATVQASASLWFEHHEVVETELTAEHQVVVKVPKEHRSLGSRVAGAARSTRGWLRRKSPEETEADAASTPPEDGASADTTA